MRWMCVGVVDGVVGFFGVNWVRSRKKKGVVGC